MQATKMDIIQCLADLLEVVNKDGMRHMRQVNEKLSTVTNFRPHVAQVSPSADHAIAEQRNPARPDAASAQSGAWPRSGTQRGSVAPGKAAVDSYIPNSVP